MLEINLVIFQQSPFPTQQIHYPSQITEGKQKNILTCLLTYESLYTTPPNKNNATWIR